MMQIPSKYNFRRERGFVLAISMIFLVVMTLLAVAAIKKSTLDEKITANLRSQNLSFQAAEKALRFCEKFLDLAAGSVTLCQPKDPNKVHANSLEADPENPLANFPTAWQDVTNWKEGGAFASTQITHSSPDAVTGLDAASQPRCMVEEWKLNNTNGGSKFPAWVITARAGPKIDAAANEKGETAVVWLQEVIRCGNM